MAAARIERLPDGEWRISGELTFGTVTALLRDSGGGFGAGQERLRIDLGGVSRADSAGLALLVCWLRRARRAGVRVLFHGVPEQLLKIARVSGLEDMLPFDGSADTR